MSALVRVYSQDESWIAWPLRTRPGDGALFAGDGQQEEVVLPSIICNGSYLICTEDTCESHWAESLADLIAEIIESK